MLDFFANCSDLCQLTVATSRRKAQQICARGSILAARALTSHALTSRAKCNQCPKNKRKITETFGEICKRKQKQLKRKRETSQAKCLFKYEYPVYLPFCFELYQTSFTLLNHRDFPIAFFCYSCETTQFCQSERLKSNLNLSHNPAMFREYRLQRTEERFNISGQRHTFRTEGILGQLLFTSTSTQI